MRIILTPAGCTHGIPAIKADREEIFEDPHLLDPGLVSLVSPERETVDVRNGDLIDEGELMLAAVLSQVCQNPFVLPLRLRRMVGALGVEPVNCFVDHQHGT